MTSVVDHFRRGESATFTDPSCRRGRLSETYIDITHESLIRPVEEAAATSGCRREERSAEDILDLVGASRELEIPAGKC